MCQLVCGNLIKHKLLSEMHFVNALSREIIKVFKLDCGKGSLYKTRSVDYGIMQDLRALNGIYCCTLVMHMLKQISNSLHFHKSNYTQ